MEKKSLLKNLSRLVGAHVSAAGGVELAIERAAEIGCNCAQVFSGSPRVWAKRPLEQHAVDKIYSNKEKLSVEPIFTHAIYLTNLASDKPELRRKSINSLTYDLKFDALVKGGGVVVHLGSHQGRGWEAVREQVAEDIKEILNQTPEESTLLIENSAGQNGKLCSDLSEIKWLLDRVGETKRLGWCFDTCHAHAAGYYLGENAPELPDESGIVGEESDLFGNKKPIKKSAKNKAPKNPVRGQALVEIEKYNLLGSLRLIHVNGSRDPFASGRDRHANLGEGELSDGDLSCFLNQPQVAHLPLVLEVPGEGKGPDAKNVARLRSYIQIGG